MYLTDKLDIPHPCPEEGHKIEDAIDGGSYSADWSRSKTVAQTSAPKPQTRPIDSAIADFQKRMDELDRTTIYTARQ